MNAWASAKGAGDPTCAPTGAAGKPAGTGRQLGVPPPKSVSALQKLTLLDYPGKTAATVFLPGCNFRCPFCHNAELVIGCGKGSEADFPNVSEEEFFSFLDKRQGLLDGVCITGGEPLLQPDIAAFCEAIKQRGFAIKLDTNGSFPNRLAELVEANLVDCVAMDVKNAPACYAETVGRPGFDVSPVAQSVAYLLSGTVPFEFRTTVVREYHNEARLRELARWIEGTPAWFLQGFVDSDTVLAGENILHGYSPEELRSFSTSLQEIVPNVEVRGI